MAIRKLPPAPKPPSLKPPQAIPLLEDLIEKAEQLRTTPYDSPLRDEWTHTSEGALSAALGSDDFLVQKLRGTQFRSSSSYDTPETLQNYENGILSSILAILRSAVQQLRWQLPDPQQVFLPSGSQHDAYVQIRSIIQQAKIEVFIIDPWVDHSLWPLLTNLPGTCKVRILGQHLKGDFQLEATKFAAQHGASIEIRVTATYHDRFVFLDGQRCFHLGASIKDAGNKAFAFSEFERSQLVAMTIADAEAEWKKATPAEHRALSSVGKPSQQAPESENQRKLRAILPWKGKVVILSQMNTGRAVMLSGPKRGSSDVMLLDCDEFTVTIGDAANPRSIPLENITPSHEKGRLELQERYP